MWFLHVFRFSTWLLHVFRYFTWFLHVMRSSCDYLWALFLHILLMLCCVVFRGFFTLQCPPADTVGVQTQAYSFSCLLTQYTAVSPFTDFYNDSLCVWFFMTDVFLHAIWMLHGKKLAYVFSNNSCNIKKLTSL